MLVNPQSANTGIIIANAPGVLSEEERMLVSNAHFVIAADGGLAKIQGLKSKVWVVGDFDSCEARSERTFQGLTKIERIDQNSNDLEKCIEFAISQDISNLLIMGAIGGRLDHTIANLSLMVKYHHQIQIALYHESTQSFAISRTSIGDNPLEIANEIPDRILSILPWGVDAEVSVTNAKWCLDRAILSAGSQGVSNRFLGGPAFIRIHRGIVICTVHD
jgi:thiamine pyrophosphokinase